MGIGHCGQERLSCGSAVADRGWLLHWSTASKPVRMNVAHTGGDHVNEGLMSSNGILVDVNQFLQPVPAAFGAVEVDGLEPVGPRFNERLPTQRIERQALDVAAAPLVDDRHRTSLDVALEDRVAHN